MNLSDLISVARILSGVDVSKLQVNKKEGFLLGFADIKLFIDDYYDCIALTNMELALVIGKQTNVSIFIEGSRKLGEFRR